MFDLTKRTLAKFQKVRTSQGKDNLFRDVKIIHKDSEDTDTIIVQLDCIEELNIDALEKLIAELIASDMVKNNLIQITSQRSGNATDIRYEGKLTIKKEPEDLL